MPVLRRLEEQTGPPAPGDASGPALERIVTFTFTNPVPAPSLDEMSTFIEHMESLYGRFADLSWLTNGAAVSYHDMVHTVVGELGPALAGVDLVITVDASPDCRHQSFPGPLLSELVGGDPMMMGVSEQGVAGPFTALRIAHHQLRTGGARRALILIMEQSTLPPDEAAIRPVRDVAVALLLGPDGSIGLGVPMLTVTRADPAGGLASLPAADLVVAGADLDGVPDDVPVRRGAPGHPCLGVWLALADLLEREPHTGGRVLVADRDPVLPYRCAVTLTVAPTPVPTLRPAPPGGYGPSMPAGSVTTRRHRARRREAPVHVVGGS